MKETTMVGIVLVTFIISLFISMYASDTKEIEFAKAGLEQCRATPTVSSRTVWVKDCKSYIETINKKDQE